MSAENANPVPAPETNVGERKQRRPPRSELIKGTAFEVKASTPFEALKELKRVAHYSYAFAWDTFTNGFLMTLRLYYYTGPKRMRTVVSRTKFVAGNDLIAAKDAIIREVLTSLGINLPVVLTSKTKKIPSPPPAIKNVGKKAATKKVEEEEESEDEEDDEEDDDDDLDESDEEEEESEEEAPPPKKSGKVPVSSKKSRK